MLKQDQPVYVAADDLDYDGSTHQGDLHRQRADCGRRETSVKGDTIVFDNKTGDLGATATVTTTTVLEQTDKDKKTERVARSRTAKDFNYEDATPRHLHRRRAHDGPDGDMTAQRIELYPEGIGRRARSRRGLRDVTLREQNRETTGTRLTYTTADETLRRHRDAGEDSSTNASRETNGRTLTFMKSTDNIVGRRQRADPHADARAAAAKSYVS